MANADSQLPEYITPQALSSANLDQPGQAYFTRSPGTQSIGARGASYSFTTIPEPNWPAPNYFSEATSSAPFTAYGTLSGYDFVSPPGLVEDVASSCDYEYFPLIHGDACATTSVSVPASHTTSTEALFAQYTGQLVEPAIGRPRYTPSMSSPESKSFRGTHQMLSQGVVPLSPGIARPGHSSLDLDGDRAVADCGTRSKIQLRTAFRKAKPKRRSSHTSTLSGRKSGQEEDEDQEDFLTPEERRARHSHNIVEKQYRNRLNAQFVRLLAVLPADQRNASSGDDSTISDAPVAEDKRVSKAEVLDLATRRIKALEERRRRLEEENSQLLGNVDAMTSNVVSRGLGKRE